MTTHETDHPGDYDPVDEDEAMGAEMDADVTDTDTDTEEPVELGAVGEDTDDAEHARFDADDAPDSSDPVAIDRTPGSDPVAKLAPADPGTELDPGTGSYQDRWAAIQAGFIDDPRRTVESASALVAEVWDETVRAITDEREGVDGRWQSTESSTDDLRAAMQDYRSLYTRYAGFTSG